MSAFHEWLIKVAENKIEEVAQRIFKECQDIAEYATAQFYEAYSPKVYKRMYAFSYVCAPFIEKGKVINGMNGYNVGIRVMHGVAVGHVGGIDDEDIFYNVMELGVHGSVKHCVSTPPITIIKNYFSNFG